MAIADHIQLLAVPSTRSTQAAAAGEGSGDDSRSAAASGLLVKHGDPLADTIFNHRLELGSFIADAPPGVDEGRPQPTQGLNYMG
jgi:hypothetical protein